MSDLEAQSRLVSVLDVVQHERQALETLRDPRLDHVLRMMGSLQAEIVATIATLGPLGSDN